MSDLNSSLYDFVYFLGLFFFLIWLLRTLWHAKELTILSAATKAHSLALLHDLLALSPRVTQELLLSYLKKKSTVTEHDVPQLVLPVILTHATSRPGSVAAGTEELQLRVCARLEGRVECYVGVSRRLLSTLYHDYDLFTNRPHPSASSDKPTTKPHTASSHKQQVTPGRSQPAGSRQQTQFLYSSESEWSSTQPVPVAMSSTLSFHVPAALMQRVRADASLLPVVVVVRADKGRANGVAASAGRAAGESGVELVGKSASKKERKQKQWLASLPHTPDASLVHLTILASAPPSSPPPASPTSPSSSSSAAFAIDSQLVIQPSSRHVWHMNDIYGLPTAAAAGASDQSEADKASSEECLVCMSEAKAVLLLPCRHLCVCAECFDSFQQQKCPVCRAPLEDWCVVTEEEEGQHSDAVVQAAKQPPISVQA